MCKNMLIGGLDLGVIPLLLVVLLCPRNFLILFYIYFISCYRMRILIKTVSILQKLKE
jgi:hypothetical protein